MPVNMDKLVSLDRAKEIKTTENGMIATVEASSTASKAYAVGEYFYYTGKLYKATAPIASGGTITVGTNCTLAKLADDVGDLKSAIITNGLQFQNLIGLESGVLYPVNIPTNSILTMSTADGEAIGTATKLCFHDENGLDISSGGWSFQANVSERTITVINGGKTAHFVSWSSTPVKPVQLCFGSNALPYIPYQLPTGYKIDQFIENYHTFVEDGITDNVTSDDITQGNWESRVITSTTKRVCSRNLYDVKQGDLLKISNNTDGIYYAYGVYVGDETSATGYSGWITAENAEYVIGASGKLFLQFATASSYGSSQDISPSDITFNIGISSGYVLQQISKIPNIESELRGVSDTEPYFNGTINKTITVSNGSVPTPSNPNAVHTDWFDVNYGDVVTLEVKKAPKRNSDYYVYSYEIKTADLSTRVKYLDYSHSATEQNKAVIDLPAAGKIAFAIAESTGSTWTALRSDDFVSGDIILKIEKSTVSMDYVESFTSLPYEHGTPLSDTDERIKIIGYNVAKYDCDTTQMIPEACVQKFREFLSHANADFVCLQENGYYIDSSHTKDVSTHLFYPLYSSYYYNGYISNAVFSKRSRVSGSENTVKVKFSNYSSDSVCMQATVFPVGNKKLLVCSYHALWDQLDGDYDSTANINGRLSQYQDILKWINGEITLNSMSDVATSCPAHDAFIVVGDFNHITATDKENIQTVTSAYSCTLGNGGRFGWLKTDKSANGSWALDNMIASSNVLIESFEPQWDWYGELYSDHVPCVANLLIQ